MRDAMLRSFLVVSGLASSAGIVFSSQIFSIAEVFPGNFSPEAPVLEGGFGAATASASLNSSFGTSTFYGEAAASADFGRVAVSSAAEIVSYLPSSYFLAGGDPAAAIAGFEDTLTITGGTGDNILYLNFLITGRTDVVTTLPNPPGDVGGPVPQGVFAVFDGPAFGPSSLVGFGNFSSFPGGATHAGNVEALLPFTYGTPFDFSVQFQSLIAINDDREAPWNTMPWSTSAVADFSSTAVLSEFRVFTDMSLTQEVGNFDAQALSGTAYRQLTAMPEPHTVLLIGFGLCAIVAGRRTPFGPRPRAPSTPPASATADSGTVRCSSTGIGPPAALRRADSGAASLSQ